MTEILYFTPAGVAKMRRKAEELEQWLQKLESQISEAAETGGNQWHDNFAYEQLTREIATTDRQLVDIHQTINRTVMTEKPTGRVVAIGVKAKIRFNGEEEEWEIGGFGESDPDNGIIAYNTPLARLIMGKAATEQVQGQIGENKVTIEIVAISVPAS